MNIGSHITWIESINIINSDQPRMRVFTGVITGHRDTPVAQFKIQVLKVSGNLPATPRDFVWVSAKSLKEGRAEEWQHYPHTFTPDELKRRGRGKKWSQHAPKNRSPKKQRAAHNKRHRKDNVPAQGNPFTDRAWDEQIAEARYGLQQAANQPSTSTRRSDWRLGRSPGSYRA